MTEQTTFPYRQNPTMPTINNNGTDRETLMLAYLDAHKACSALLDAMDKATPHGRDYQLAPDRYEKARDEFSEHRRNINKAGSYLMDVVLGIYDQK